MVELYNANSSMVVKKDTEGTKKENYYYDFASGVSFTNLLSEYETQSITEWFAPVVSKGKGSGGITNEIVIKKDTIITACKNYAEKFKCFRK